MVYVGLGGGGNPQNDKVLTCLLSILSENSEFRIVCPVKRLGTNNSVIFESENCIPITHYPMLELYSAFDFAVLSAGMNNIAEATFSGLPAIWLPLGHPSTDQEFNANLFTKQGYGKTVKPFNSQAFRSVLNTYNDYEARERMRSHMLSWSGGHGAENAARAVLDCLCRPGG